ncbi:MAG TPA: hypothetical protein VNT75_01765 [Symbiobacteriaceae bacterium]|nr:hypothetical protein [Symbiobacteriaceae bacterium]
MLTTQTLLQKKVFGNFLSLAKPLDYRQQDWKDLNKGRERSVRLIIKAMMGVPSAHVGENEHAMWCFQFPKGSLLVVHLHRGTVIELAARKEDEPKEIEEVVDFLIEEVSTRIKQL